MTDINLPDGWFDASLDDVLLSIVGGGTPSKSNVSYFQGSIPWMSVKDMNKNTLDDTVDHITQEAVENSSTNVIPAGTPIVATRMSLGKIVVVNFDSAINQDLKALFHATGIERDYLVNWYRANSKLIESLGTGTTVKGIRLEVLRALKFPLPPLAEQKVIADKLDTLLAQVETTKARLERIPKILKTFRQSVLAAAVSGKLTEEWRGDDSYSNSGYPNDWKMLGFSDVGQLARGKSKHRPRNDPKLFGDEYPFIQTGEVANSGGEILKATKFLSEFGLAQSKLFPKGTLCITIAANIADTSILGIDACFPDSVVGFTPTANMCNALFVKYLIDVNKANLEDFAPATAQKNINLKILNAMRIPFPSLDEQTQIVRRVEELFSFADRIEQKANAALKRVNNLTQSILAKAFRGELTADWRAQNPGLISGDNSAEALLEKIKAEREANKSANKGKKKLTRKTKKEIQPKILLENPVVGVLNKIGIAKPQAIFDELKELMDLREVLKEISQLLEQQVIKEIDKDGQQYLEINR
jgi:type I restriction enzyme S subunit